MRHRVVNGGYRTHMAVKFDKAATTQALLTAWNRNKELCLWILEAKKLTPERRKRYGQVLRSQK